MHSEKPVSTGKRKQEQNMAGWNDGKTISWLAGPEFSTLAHKTNEESNHAPTRPRRWGQGRGIGQPAAEVGDRRGC